MAYDAATGTQLWVTRYNGPGNSFDIAHALGVSPEGSTVYVTGYSSGGASIEDFTTVAYDAATGAQLWVTRYNGPGNGFDVARALGVSPDGSTTFITGESVGGASAYDYATVAYDAATGAQLWVTRYNGPANGSDLANALGVSPEGSRVFVTGESGGGDSLSDYATVAHDPATGAQLWASRAQGRGSDYANALGVAPSGAMVYVTGSKQVKGDGSTDYGTIAYEA